MEQVIAELSELNKKVDVIVGIMKKPENRFIKVLEIAGMVITVMSFLSVIDIIRNWLGF
jgi:preprotein translocase subunit Sss1